MTKKFLQSYLYTKDFGSFFISTCLRNSSAALASDLLYYETFAWIIENDKRTNWIADNSGALSPDEAIEQHAEVCRQLLKTSKFE